jgi:hypothetical protein
MTDLKTNSTDSRVPLDQIAQPWLKRRSEGYKAYAAFKLYFGLREERSLEAVAKILKKHKSQIGAWSTDHQWVERADAYLDWCTQVEQKENERLAKQTAKRLAQFREQRREEKLRFSDGLLETSRLMAKVPLFEQVAERYEDGRVKTIVKPAKWVQRDRIKFGQAAFAMGDEVLLEATTSTETKVVDDYVPTPYIGERDK